MITNCNIHRLRYWRGYRLGDWPGCNGYRSYYGTGCPFCFVERSERNCVVNGCPFDWLDRVIVPMVLRKMREVV